MIKVLIAVIDLAASMPGVTPQVGFTRFAAPKLRNTASRVPVQYILFEDKLFSMDARVKPGHDEPRIPRRNARDQYSVAFSRSGAVRSCSGPPILPWVRSARIVPALGRLLRSTWRDASHSFERTIALAH